MPSKAGCILNCHDVRRRFHGAKERLVPPGRAANIAKLMLGEHPAAFAMADCGYARAECPGQFCRPVPTPLEQVKRDSLRRFLADTRHALERIDQANQQG
jgi:hypothetical protein